MPCVQRGKGTAISTRWTRRVAAPCVCFAPWAALASCRPLPQQLLPVSAAGGGRRRCKQGAARPFQPQRGWAPYKKASCFAKTGCGAQRPLRALSGTRVLLTAAPTAPPCIRRWRRSSPLHFFLASPIDRPLSRCGGSSPQGSQRLQLPFAVTTPSREKENLKNPQIFQILKIKIIFPLKMPRVKRRAFQIVRRLKGSPCKTKPFP